MNEIEKINIKNAIRLVLGGSMFDKDLYAKDIPKLLKELTNDYLKAIKEAKKELNN